MLLTGARAHVHAPQAREDAKPIRKERLGRGMEGRAAGARAADVPTLLYVVYISIFLVLLGAGGYLFGFNLATLAFAAFAVLVILMIGFTSRLIYRG